MRPIQIVCDSTAAFTAEEIAQMDLMVVPFSIQMDGETYEEGTPDTYSAFYERMAASRTLPTTSQPSISRFQDAFDQALSLGRDVVAVMFSGGLSGSCGAAQVAAEHTDASRITVVDSLTGIANLKNLVTAAWQGAKAGLSALQIKELLEERRPRVGIFFTVGDLSYLRRGGRLSNSQYFVGKLLNILPLLVVRDGKILPSAKIRGDKAMMTALLEAAPENTKSITMVHISNEEAANALRSLLLKRFPSLEIETAHISPVMGAHIGPGAFGYCFEW